MPESVLHDEAVGLLRAILAAWAARLGERQVVRNLAVRWDHEHPQFGVDPDVAVLSPPPPDGAALRSVRTWVAGHAPPLLAIEVVSETNPRKDYVIAPDKYAASGVQELWIFDPLLTGPTSHGGPFRIQIWSRTTEGDLVRIFAGDGVARSPILDAYVVAVDEGHKLRIATDSSASHFWLTQEEAERTAKEAALARVAELEARLAAGRT
jgi:hypothetical protein